MMGAILTILLLLAIGAWILWALRQKNSCSGDCDHCPGCKRKRPK